MSFYRRWIHYQEHRLAARDKNRRILPFEWGLDWISANSAAENPLDYVKSYAEQALGDSWRFYASPPLLSYSLTGTRLTFPTPALTPYPTNNQVYCRLFPARDKRHAVIVVPQWNADSTSHVGICRMLQRFGMTAARLCLPYHEGRLPPGMKRADYMISPNVGRTLHATRQAVIEIRQLAHWLHHQDYERISVLGTSIGSCVGYLAFTHEPLICSGVFNHVSSFFADVVWNGLSTRYIRWGLEGSIRLEDLRYCWAPISPWYFVPHLKSNPRPHLLITAKYDLSFTPELAQKIFDRYQLHNIPCHQVVLPCGHYTTARFPFKYLDGWIICRYLIKQLSQPVLRNRDSVNGQKHSSHRPSRRG